MLTLEGEEIASDGAAHTSWMSAVEKVPVTTVDILILLWICLGVVFAFSFK